MAEVFLKILNMGMAGSWLILAVIILRFGFQRMPKWVRPVLWGIVGLRLMLPISFESTFSLIPSAQPLPEDVLTGHTFRIDSGVSAIDNPINSYFSDNHFRGMDLESMAPSGNHIPFMAVLGIVWIAGVGMMFFYALISYLRLRKSVSASVLLFDNIRVCDQVPSPFILGILRPVIYLPTGLDEGTQRYVLAHERMHLKRWDHLWKPLGYFILSVYWFHPLVWAAYILLCKDIELACDEKVIADLDMMQRKAYANALVDCSMQRRMVTVCPLAFGETGVKERVKTVLYYKKPAFWVLLTALVLCVILAVCFLSNPKRKTYDITVRVPAGSGMGFYFSNEMIWSHGDSLTLLSKSDGLDADIELMELGDVTEFYADEDKVAAVFHMDAGPVKIPVEKHKWYRVGVRLDNAGNDAKEICIQARGVDTLVTERSDNDINLYRTEYIGDAPKVSGIARRLPYPEGYAYSGIEIQSETEPYGLYIYLDGNGSATEDDFRDAAQKAFELIGNMGSIEFCGGTSDNTIAYFTRADFASKDADMKSEDKDSKSESENSKSTERKNQDADVASGDEVPDNTIGLTMKVMDATPRGCMLFFVQKDGKVEGKLETGLWYKLQKQEQSGQWSYVKAKNDAGWEDVAYDLKMDSTTEMDIIWKTRYGELEPGSYRIIKQVMDYRAPGDYDTHDVSAEFQIMEQNSESVTDWLSVNLPEGYALGNFYDNIGYMGGSLILPRSYATGASEDEPVEWRYSGMISRIPAGKTKVTFTNGIPDLAGIPIHNHTAWEYDKNGLERPKGKKQWPILTLKASHDLYTHPEIEQMKQDGVDVDNMELSADYWEFWFVKEGEDLYYVLTLSAKEFSYEEAINIARTVVIRG